MPADSQTIPVKAASQTTVPSTDSQAAPVPKWMFWTGWVLSLLPMPLLLMSAVMKFLQPPEVVEGFTKLGWPMNLAVPLGILELVCTVLYLIPRTSVLGAILLTGYLGGAIATHVRIGDSFAMVVVFGVVLWLGLYFRDRRLQALIPLRTPQS